VSAPAWLEAAAKLEAEEKAGVAVIDPPATAAKPPSRIAGRPHIVLMPDVEEVDLAWRGYSLLGMIPATVVVALATVSAIVLIRPLVPTWIVHEAFDAPAVAIWVLQLIRAVYRFIAYDYRLTNSRLYRSRGPLYPPERPVDLASVVRADVHQTAIGRLLGVGNVTIVCEDDAANRELEGVRGANPLAARIDEAAKTARERSVSATRVRSDQTTAVPR
jgi:membrane protein YdbS with pleckstrin-like domain